MKVNDLVGKEYVYLNNVHKITEVKKIQKDNKEFKYILYSDTNYPVSYDIVFLKETGTYIDISA